MSQELVRRKRITSFLCYSLKLDGIIDLLSIVDKEPIYFSGLYRTSKIVFKKSFLKYLRYCVDHGFMTKSWVSRTGAHERFHARMSIRKFFVFYHITDKGRNFLELVQ